MNTADFNYELPPGRIAQTPLDLRDHSRLMVLNRADNSIRHRHFYDIIDFLNKGDVLVFNDSRVIPARLYGHVKDTKTRVELLLLHETEKGVWEALAKPAKKLKTGSIIKIESKARENPVLVRVQSKSKSGTVSVHITDPDVLKTSGIAPLPPYIHAPIADPERYQTVYSKNDGSVAAPTAGLHFTPALMDRLYSRGIEFAFVTLHVGLGTFRPVKVNSPQNHEMHNEFCFIDQHTAERINRANREGRKIICVGTTTVRAVEGAVGPNGEVQPYSGWNGLYILPGFNFQITDAMITNFHLPCSTLLMLVSAFAGREEVLGAYQEAIEHDYRFYSFGDCMFIFGETPAKL